MKSDYTLEWLDFWHYELKKRIIASGGFCNSHAHFDRAGTISQEDLKETVNNHLFEKWKHVDDIH